MMLTECMVCFVVLFNVVSFSRPLQAVFLVESFTQQVKRLAIKKEDEDEKDEGEWGKGTGERGAGGSE